MRLTGRGGTLVAGLAGLALGLLALGPGIAPGYLLSYDMVFVPDPSFTATTFGLTGTLPRAVPSDAVVALLAQVLPADLVQKLVLLLIFALACSGAAALLAERPFVARLVAGVCFCWNPFVGERLIIGQWALLLGYAGLPWVVCALTRPGPVSWRSAGRLAVALLPAAIGGFAPMCLSALVVLPGAALAAGQSGRQRLGRVMAAAAVLGALSMPWLIPSVTRTVHTSGSGVAAFAARADTPFGSFGSLLMLGGTWNSQTVPYGYGGAESWLWLAVAGSALAGFVLLGRGRWPGLGVGAACGLVIASADITGVGADILRGLIAAWPGFAVFRDGQQFVGPLALAEATGLGLAAAWLLGLHWPERWRDIRWLAAVLVLVAPVVLLPGLAWGAAGRLRSVQYPADWLAARRLIDKDPAAGRVLLLPWAAYRRFGWNDGEAVLDPWPRLVNRDVIWNDAVTVGRITVPAESPAARELTGPITTSAGPLTGVLLAAGVRYVIVDAGLGSGQAAAAGQAGRYPYLSRLPGCRVVLAGPGLVVYQLPSGGRSASNEGYRHVKSSNELDQHR